MRFQTLVYALAIWSIIVGGWIIFFGKNPPPPQCIVCGFGLPIGTISVLVGLGALGLAAVAGRSASAAVR